MVGHEIIQPIVIHDYSACSFHNPFTCYFYTNKYLMNDIFLQWKKCWQGSRIQYQWALEPDITSRSNSAKASANESMISPPSKMIMYSGVFQVENLQHRRWRYQHNKESARYHGLALDFDYKINTGYCSRRVFPQNRTPDVAAARRPALVHSTCPTVKSARDGCECTSVQQGVLSCFPGHTRTKYRTLRGICQSSKSLNLEFLKRCVAQSPAGGHVTHFNV